MLHTFLENASFRARIDRALDALSPELKVEQFVTEEAKSLRRGDQAEARAGSKPLLTLCSASGACFAFKQCEAPLAAAEEAAYELRRLGRRPAVPARAMSIELEGEGAITGLLKPFVDFNVSAELDADTTTWTVEQRAVMLAEHAWEWFLDNLDTNTSQYALFGSLRLPVNIDWDRAFHSDGRSELSRFTKYKPQLPNARTFLYADYVHGKVKLPLWMLANEARRINRLPTGRVRAILARYAAVRFADPDERQAFISRTLVRQRGIEREVDKFMRSLWSERQALAAPADSVGEWLHRKGLIAWAAWQRVLNVILRGPLGRGARRLLSLFRGRQNRANGASDPEKALPSRAVE
jgi:dipeptidyl aminopeptidase/acylaminoacyl peptidase